jgi:hypothetical protein
MTPNLDVEQLPRAASAASSKRRSMMASTVGNVLEGYEWSAYAVFTPFIAKAMFKADDPVSALLSTLAVYAVGFLMRPLGGIVFGRIADVKGRKFVLITTMLVMAGGSLDPVRGFHCRAPNRGRFRGPALFRSIRSVPDESPNPRNWFRLLVVRRRLRRHSALSECPFQELVFGLAVEHLHHGPLRTYRSGGLQTPGN